MSIESCPTTESPDVACQDVAEKEPLIHTRIQPARGWTALGLRELWAYRELLYFLTWRDIKVRYKQTVLGAAWAVIQPFFMMVVFSLFFGKLAGVPSDELPYPIFSFAALVPWTFFSNALTQSSNSLVQSANLIRNAPDVVVAREVLTCCYTGRGVELGRTEVRLPLRVLQLLRQPFVLACPDHRQVAALRSTGRVLV